MEAEPGMVIRAIRRAGTKNPVILLDELDRVTPESRAAIMGTLLEILDPTQNRTFHDYFIDFPFDLSEVLFIATANNTANVATAVLDRLELIQMPSYTDEEKIHIAKNYVLPKYLTASGLAVNQLRIDDTVWAKLARPLGFDAGIRTLERTVESIVRKAAYKIVSGEGKEFIITEGNLKEYFLNKLFQITFGDDELFTLPTHYLIRSLPNNTLNSSLECTNTSVEAQWTRKLCPHRIVNSQLINC